MNCIIIEDEIPAQNVLKNFILKAEDIALVKMFNNAIEANSFLKTNAVDLLFLDINLPEINGLDFIKTVNNAPLVIVTTAYPNYALDSFELETIVDYLVKPFAFSRFLKAVNKAQNRFNLGSTKQQETIYLNVDKTHYKLNLNDILYIESDRNYITLVTTTKKLCYIESLKHWVNKLQNTQFIQTHKSFIVNTNKIEKISGNQIIIDNQKLPIGRTYKQHLLKMLKIG